MASKYTWSRMTPNPVAHLTTPGDEFQMPLCGARLDIRTQTLGDLPPSQYVPVCSRCEARQRRLDRAATPPIAKLTDLQVQILRDARDHSDPLRLVFGFQQRGGATISLLSLQRRGLIKGNSITDAGREALAAYEAKP